jgi:biopolymer transport protein ExbD
VQEWEADRDVINEGYDVYEYRLLIFRQLFGYRADITCGLNSQTSKKRFLMMTDFRKGKLSFVRFGAVVPLVAVMVLAFGAVRAETEVEVVQSELQTPDEKNAEVYLAADGKIFFDGEEMTIEELRSALEKLRAEKGVEVVLNIRTETATKMGAIENVKLAARQSKVLKVRYVTPDREIDKILPPPEGDPNIPYDVEISEDLKHKKVDFLNLRVAKNNLLMIVMNAAGQVLTTRPDGNMGLVELAEVKDIVKQFIDNSESVNNSRKVKNPHYSSFTWQTIKRSADGEVHYPVSDGVISIQTTRDTSADNYLALQAAIVEAYAELREELSQRSFHKPFASLEGYDREYILQAIPMRVSEADPRLPSGASK